MHKRSAQDPACNEASPTKVLVSQSGSTPQQQWRASHTSEPFGPHLQQYSSYKAAQHHQQQWCLDQPSPAAQPATRTQIHPCQRNAQTSQTAADGNRPCAAQWQQQAPTGAGCCGAQQQQLLQQQCSTQLATTSPNVQLQQHPRQWQQQHQQVNALHQQEQHISGPHHQQPQQQVRGPHNQQQHQQAPQEQQPCFQQQYSPSPQQQNGCSQLPDALQAWDDHHQQQMQWGQAAAGNATWNHHQQQQQWQESKHGWVHWAHPSQQGASPALQSQQLSQQQGTAMQQQTQPLGPALQQQQQQQFNSTCHSPQQQVQGWQQQQRPNSVQQLFTPPSQQRWQQQQQLDLSSPMPRQQQQQPSMQSPLGTPISPFTPPAAAAAAAAGNSLKGIGWTPASPPLLPSPMTSNFTPSPGAATTPPGSSSSSSSRVCSRFPSIWKLIRHSLRLQQAVVNGDVVVLCGALCLDEWHVRHEVVRLRLWFQLTFWLRVVLEQWCVLDIVSPRTLLQLPHIPPQHLTLLDAWIREDMAAAAAAAAAAASGGAGAGAGVFSEDLCTDQLSTKYSSYWKANNGKGPAAMFRDLPPSWAITQLLMTGRLKWVPAAAAAEGPFTAARHGSYTWQHGPVDAWLCSDSSSSSSEAAAARSMRAEQLRSMTHPRIQAKLLLETSCTQQQQQQYSSLIGTSGSSSSSVLNPIDALGFGVLELGFRSEELSHPASCHLQRHPVLADHDRLIRVTISSKAAAAAAGSSSSGDGSRALDGVLTQGVLLAGRRYRRLVQKDIGKSSESLWLLACESVCREDTSGPLAWPSTNPAAARQMLGAFSSLPSISKQSARGALLVSNTLPLQIQAHNIFYVPDINGPTDTCGNIIPQQQHNTSGSGSSSSSVSSEVVLSDGSGFMSADVSLLVPAVSAGEVVPADRGGGATWPGGPVQVRVFDPHYGGVISKGTLTPLSKAVLPQQTIILRISQVKAPAAKQFWQKWSRHWNNMLIWAHQQHQQQQQQQQQQLSGGQAQWQQQQRVVRQPGHVAVLRGDDQQQQQQQLVEDVSNFSLQQPTVAAAAAALMEHHLPPAGGHGGLQGQVHHQQQQQQQNDHGVVKANTTATSSGTSSRQTCLINQAAAAAAAAAYCASQRPAIMCIHPQDRPWFQQIWFVHDALQLWASSSSSSGITPSGTTPPPRACQPAVAAAAAASSSHISPHTTSYNSSSSGQTAAGGLSLSPACPIGLVNSSSNSSSSNVVCCCCPAVLEVVSRAPSGCEKPGELRINKNLMLLLHHAGVPQHVFEEWCDIEQHKLVGIDTSYERAYAAARAIGDIEVINKLEALIGVQLPHPHLSSSGSSSLFTTPESAAAAGANATAFSSNMSSQLLFKPDLALMQDLHNIKVRRCQKLALMSLPVPSAQDTAAAVAAGVIRAEGNMLPTPNAAGGVRLLGVPDPSCGRVPEGCVAVSPGLVPPSGQAVIYRDPGIHPGDVRRVRVIPYPQDLLRLLPPQFSGAIFFPTVGSSCLGASLAGGDYDGDIYLLLWDQRVVTCYRAQDPEPYLAPGAQNAPLGGATAAVRPQGETDGLSAYAAVDSGGGGGGGCESKADVWGVSEGCGWQQVEEMWTAYYRFCWRVSGAMKEAHALWECYADKCGVDNGYCLHLAHVYNQAIDAPKTGKEPFIPDLYQKNSTLGVDINKLPSWHSRVIKEAAKTTGRRAVAASQDVSRDRPAGVKGRSNIVWSLWRRIHDLSPVDYLDPSLLDLDPDLVLQSGSCGVSSQVMEDLIKKWDGLCDEWNRSWAQVMRKADSARTSCDQQSLIDEKADLQAMMKARFQVELWGGLEALGAAAAGGSSSIMDRTLMEASACYQAVYRRAKTKQDNLRSLTEDQRNSRKKALGYEDMPRVAMAWRVAGQWLRMLKATKPLREQQALMMQELQRLQEDTGSRTTVLAGVQGLAGSYMGGSGRAAGSRVELGAVQHPYLAAVVAQQQSRRGQLRGYWGAAASLGDGL